VVTEPSVEGRLVVICFTLITSYEGVSKRFRTESITKYTLTFDIAQRFMAAKLTRLTHKIEI
jgi:hypothetical protein